MIYEPSVLTTATTMSLDQRFTQLRREVRGRGIRRRMSVSGLVSQDINVRPELASVKSRRLAVHMSRRPAVIAALNGALDGRINTGGVINRRGSFRGRGSLRIGRDRRTNNINNVNNRSKRSSSVGRTRRSNSVGRLSRSQSLQSLNNLRATSPAPFRGRGGGRGRGGRGGRGLARGRLGTASGGGALSDIGSGTLGGVKTGRVGFRGRGRGQRWNNNFTAQRGGRGRGGFNPTNRQGGTGVQRGAGGRGARRGFRRGGRGGRGGKQQNAPPTKEKLDMELDEYMALSKSNLDKEIDTYMSKTEEVWE